MTRVFAHGCAASEPLVPERVCLVRVGGKTHHYDVSVMMIRIEGTQWYLANAEGLLSIENLASDEVIPFLLGDDGWPIDNGLTEKGWEDEVRLRARALANVLRAAADDTEVRLPGGSRGFWYVVDPTYEYFGAALDDGRILGGDTHIREAVAGIDMKGTRYTFVEVRSTAGLTTWRAEKLRRDSVTGTELPELVRYRPQPTPVVRPLSHLELVENPYSRERKRKILDGDQAGPPPRGRKQQRQQGPAPGQPRGQGRAPCRRS